MAEKHNLNQKLLKEVHAQPWQDVVGCFVPKHHDTYKIFALVLAKGSYNCKRRQYSMVFDQPDVEPINMHTSITSTEARRISIPTSGKNPARHIMVCIVVNRFLIVAL